jgi:pimeloyl-ACP methyl ester carboxylesterase
MHVVQTIKSGTEKVAYLRLGSSDPNAPIALLLHGFPGNAFDWSHQFQMLDKHFQIIAPFMPGVLDGEIKSADRYAMPRIIADLQTVLDTIDPKQSRPIFIVGHDLGCFFAAALADQLKSRVQAVVHINGMGLQQYFHRLHRVSTWLKSFYILLFQFCFIRTFIIRWIPQQILPFIYRKCGLLESDEQFRNDEKVLASIAVYASLFREVWTFLGQAIRRSSHRTLFIWGNADIFLDIPHRREVDRYCENATIRVVRGGHWVSRSAYHQVNSILEKFLTPSASKEELNSLEVMHASI